MVTRARGIEMGDLSPPVDPMTTGENGSRFFDPTSVHPDEELGFMDTADRWNFDHNIRVDAIETLPHKTLVGYCAIVSPEGVHNLYEKLWRAFLSRMEKLVGFQERAFYGVCCNLQANRLFEYWLAVEVHPGEDPPRDLIPFQLFGGTYGSSVEERDFSLPSIYNALIQRWIAPVDYTLDWKLPFFEIHVPGRQTRSAVKICLPLKFAVMNYKDYLSVCLGA
ncbi:MAG: GyrI-like domain-containing protein [Deltaproteobacteria bacterium]|jgi:predicted transcriptional regulator YdeE|nr:GyrI-like domain-containing protein [Deltaproteobacteria bacterium]